MAYIGQGIVEKGNKIFVSYPYIVEDSVIFLSFNTDPGKTTVNAYAKYIEKHPGEGFIAYLSTYLYDPTEYTCFILAKSDIDDWANDQVKVSADDTVDKYLFDALTTSTSAFLEYSIINHPTSGQLMVTTINQGNIIQPAISLIYTVSGELQTNIDTVSADLQNEINLHLSDYYNPHKVFLAQVLSLSSDASGYLITNSPEPVTPSDVSNKGYIDTLVAITSGASNALWKILEKDNSAGAYQINMNDNRIINLGYPISGSDAASKQYVDDVAGRQDTLQEITERGNTTTLPIFTAGLTTSGDIIVIGSETVTGTLSVKGPAIFDSCQIIKGNQIISGNETLSGNLTVKGIIQGLQTLTINSSAQVHGLDVGFSRITNVGYPAFGPDATNKTYVDNVSAEFIYRLSLQDELSEILAKNNSAGNYQINMNGNRIINMATPILSADVTTKSYVDTISAEFIGRLAAQNELKEILSYGNSAGTYQIDMNGNRIIHLGTPTASADAVTKTYVDTISAEFINRLAAQNELKEILSYGNSAGPYQIDMNQNRVINVGSPVASGDAVTLKWFTDNTHFSLDYAYNWGSDVLVDDTNVQWRLYPNKSFLITDESANPIQRLSRQFKSYLIDLSYLGGAGSTYRIKSGTTGNVDYNLSDTGIQTTFPYGNFEISSTRVRLQSTQTAIPFDIENLNGDLRLQGGYGANNGVTIDPIGDILANGYLRAANGGFFGYKRVQEVGDPINDFDAVNKRNLFTVVNDITGGFDLNRTIHVGSTALLDNRGVNWVLYNPNTFTFVTTADSIATVSTSGIDTFKPVNVIPPTTVNNATPKWYVDQNDQALLTAIITSSAYNFAYTTNVSGNLLSLIYQTSASILNYVKTSDNYLFNLIDSSSGILNTKIDYVSGSLLTYINTASANLEHWTDFRYAQSITYTNQVSAILLTKLLAQNELGEILTNNNSASGIIIKDLPLPINAGDSTNKLYVDNSITTAIASATAFDLNTAYHHGNLVYVDTGNPVDWRLYNNNIFRVSEHDGFPIFDVNRSLNRLNIFLYNLGSNTPFYIESSNNTSTVFFDNNGFKTAGTNYDIRFLNSDIRIWNTNPTGQFDVRNNYGYIWFQKGTSTGIGFTSGGLLDSNYHRILNVSTPISSGDAVNKAYVDALSFGLSGALYALDTQVVHLGGTELIYGDKIFATTPQLTGSVVNPTDIVNKQYVDSRTLQQITDAGNTTSNIIHLTNPTTGLLVDGNIRLNNTYITGLNYVPLTPDEAASKFYVDTTVSSASGSLTLQKVTQNGAVSNQTITLTNPGTGLIIQGDLVVLGTSYEKNIITITETVCSNIIIGNELDVRGNVKLGDDASDTISLLGRTYYTFTPVVSSEIVNKGYVDNLTATLSSSIVSSDLWQSTNGYIVPKYGRRTATLNLIPISGSELTSKFYVDTNVAILSAQMLAQNELAEILANGNSAGSYQINMNGNRIINVASPIISGDAVNKGYVDSISVSATGQNHATLSNLDFLTAGHTGFVSTSTSQVIDGQKTFTNSISGTNILTIGNAGSAIAIYPSHINLNGMPIINSPLPLNDGDIPNKYYVDTYGGGWDLKHIVLVNQDKPEIVGKRYTTITDAINYILTQSPAPSAMWGVYFTGTYSESVTVPGSVRLFGLTGISKITGQLNSSATNLFNDNAIVKQCVVNNLAVTTVNTLQLVDCDVTSIVSSNGSVLAQNCQFINGNFSQLALLMMLNCNISNGNYGSTALIENCNIFDGYYTDTKLKECTIHGGTFLGNCEFDGCNFDSTVTISTSSNHMKFTDCSDFTLVVQTSGTADVTNCAKININLQSEGTLNTYGLFNPTFVSNTGIWNDFGDIYNNAQSGLSSDYTKLAIDELKTIIDNVVTSGGGVTNHALLTNLDYGVAGHTNFASLNTTQTISGVKTFSSPVTISAAGTGLIVNNDAFIGGTLTVGSSSIYISPTYIDVNSNKILNVPIPTNLTDAVNKEYVDTLIESTSGAGYWLTQNTILIDPNQNEQTGKRYQTISNALVYISTQTPSASSRWGISLGGINDESFSIPPFVTIIGQPSITKLTGEINSSSSTLDAVIVNCTVDNANPTFSGIPYALKFVNCDVTLKTGALGIVDCEVCRLVGGDWTNLTSGTVYYSYITDGTYNNLVTFNNSYINGGIWQGATLSNCNITGGTWGPVYLYTFDNCNFGPTVILTTTNSIVCRSCSNLTNLSAQTGGTLYLYNCTNFSSIQIDGTSTLSTYGLTNCSVSNSGTWNDYGQDYHPTTGLVATHVSKALDELKTLVDSITAAASLVQVLGFGNSAGPYQIDMNNNKILNVAVPTTSGDAVNKYYVDTLVGLTTGFNLTYDYEQYIPATGWLINHNFNSDWFGYVIYLDNEVIKPNTVSKVDKNNCLISYTVPVSGSAHLFVMNANPTLFNSSDHSKLSNLDYSVAGHTGFVGISNNQVISGTKTFSAAGTGLIVENDAVIKGTLTVGSSSIYIRPTQLDMNNYRIINIPEPQNLGDAVPKQYVDTLVYTISGASLSGNYVTINTDQIVTGHKDFQSGIQLSSTGVPVGGTAGELRVFDNELYIYDSTRTKWLSSNRMAFSFTRGASSLLSQYLRVGETVTSTQGYLIPTDSTITNISVSTRDNCDASFEIKKNNSILVIGSLTLSGTNSGTTSGNIDLIANDVLQLYLNVYSGTVEYPIVWLEIAKKKS